MPMIDSLRTLGIVAMVGTIMLAGGVSGCSSLSGSHVDCNVVKLQAESGRSDNEIASAIGASESDVAACHGPSKSGNSTSGGAQSGNY
jgi:hypothetical protein